MAQGGRPPPGLDELIPRPRLQGRVFWRLRLKRLEVVQRLAPHGERIRGLDLISPTCAQRKNGIRASGPYLCRTRTQVRARRQDVIDENHLLSAHGTRKAQPIVKACSVSGTIH